MESWALARKAWRGLGGSATVRDSGPAPSVAAAAAAFVPASAVKASRVAVAFLPLPSLALASFFSSFPSFVSLPLAVLAGSAGAPATATAFGFGAALVMVWP